MGESLSPDRIFDFPKDKLEPHPAYDFFTPAPLPGYAGNPNNNNGWLEADDYLLGELQAMVDERMVIPVIEEVAEPVNEVEEEQEVNEERLMAPITPPPVPAGQPLSVYEVGAPSTMVAEGPSFLHLAQRLSVPPFVIKDLSTRLGNLDDLSSCAGSELGSELTSFVGSELGSELTSLAGNELGLLYFWGKENEIYILQSIDHGPFELGTTKDTLGTTPEGGLPKDIYKLINHNIKAKAIWDNVKMLLDGSELTKKDIESHLYDEFKRFKMLLGENINEYYVRFHKLVNDMRNIRMTMPNIQLNSKFVNNMSPEWDRDDKIRLKELCSRNGAAGNEGAQIRAGNVNEGQGKPIKCFNCNGIGHIARHCTQPKHKCDAFESDVDDEPTAQSIFMANLSLARPTNQQAGPSNASILSEVHDLENGIDPCDDNQDEHVIHNEVQ
nr:hypothetical protein [Tanacetum cinerariifolium]